MSASFNRILGRTSMRLFQSRSTATNACRRWASTRAGPGVGTSVVVATGLAAGFTAYTAYKHYGLKLHQDFIPRVHAAAKIPDSQTSVYSPTKEHALYLWIHLKPTADAKKCASVVADLEQLVNTVCPPDLKSDDNEILAGVGFSPAFYAKVSGKTKKNYAHQERKGPLGNMPNGGGDIFIHAKSDNVSKLFELAQLITSKLPAGSIDKFQDTYSFVYRNGRDLSGFIDGTENPADDDDRKRVAVETETGGSYVITQKWIHKLDVIAKEKDHVLEKFVGRSRDDSVELRDKAVTSHVARMTGGTSLSQKKVFEIVRQSMPYGNLHDHAGLFFIAYAASPENFNYMLDRMVGVDKDGHSDEIMRLSECVASTYWYFPGVAELKKLR